MTRLNRILLVFVLALACAAGVRAEMWVWVDEQGTAHWADHQVDARYWLFSKAKKKSDAIPAETNTFPEKPSNDLMFARSFKLSNFEPHKDRYVSPLINGHEDLPL